jgi:hypothetical protein
MVSMGGGSRMLIIFKIMGMGGGLRTIGNPNTCTRMWYHLPGQKIHIFLTEIKNQSV